MNSCMLRPRDILKRERATLEWLRSQAASQGSAPNGLYQTITEALLRMDDSVGMRVVMTWEVMHDSAHDRLVWVYVGGDIELQQDNIAQLTYCLCVSDDAPDGQRRRILRKYHFDYANPANARRRPHPIFHLQYPGRLPASLAQEYDDSHQDPGFDEPRIIYTPMSLAMVLHIAFREFPDDFTERVRQDSYWLNILRTDQVALLLPYYQSCVQAISANRLLMDVAYGG